MNRVELEGKVGRDVKVLGEGKVLAFSVGTAEKGRDGNWTSVWHRVVCFGKVIEDPKPLAEPGDRIRVVGKIKYGKYQHRDGTERNTVDIVAFEVSRPERKDTPC